MTDGPAPRWLDWAREMQSLAQTGLAFSTNQHDRRGFERFQEIAAGIVVDSFDFINLPPLSRERANERHLDEAWRHLADPLRPAAVD